jgi:hypothetical protein
METTVKKAELITERLTKFDGEVTIVKREIQEIWDGMDYLSNPLK